LGESKTGSKSTSHKMTFFEGRPFRVFDEVYEPAEDTFLIAEHLEVNPDERVLDIGTGCGILSILSALKAREVVATDINPHATRCAKLNAEINGVSEKADIILGDLFNPLKEDSLFDLILFNAPYLPTEDEELKGWVEYAWAGGKGGGETIDRFVASAFKYLKPGGRILLIQSSLSDVVKTLRGFRKKGFETRIGAERKVGFETIALIEARRPQEGQRRRNP